MKIDPRYKAQVDLLLSVIPHIAKENNLALKGGTAINLFVRDLPRLSVDIDLTYTGFEPRREALQSIHESLETIKSRIVEANPDTTITPALGGDGQDVKLNCQLNRAQIKIEVNTTTRGTLFPVKEMIVTEAVQDAFGKFAAINVVSMPELYGGKICAALDRQHPRDLFDVALLMDNEGIDDDLKYGFLSFLLSHNRPINEVIAPNFKDQRQAYDQQFLGMSDKPFSYNEYKETRIRLVETVQELLTDTDKKFLLSFKQCEPQWDLFPLADLKRLPAVQWKLKNLQQLKATNPEKHQLLLNTLEDKLS